MLILRGARVKVAIVSLLWLLLMYKCNSNPIIFSHHPSERVVLRRDLVNKVFSNDGHLTEDVFPDFGYLAKEKQREDSGGDAEAGGDRAIAVGFHWRESHQIRYVFRPVCWSEIFSHSIVRISSVTSCDFSRVIICTGKTYLGP